MVPVVEDEGIQYIGIVEFVLKRARNALAGDEPILLWQRVVAAMAIEQHLGDLACGSPGTERCAIAFTLIKVPTAGLGRRRVEPDDNVTALIPGTAALLNLFDSAYVLPKIAICPFEGEAFKLVSAEIGKAIHRVDRKANTKTE